MVTVAANLLQTALHSLPLASNHSVRATTDDVGNPLQEQYWRFYNFLSCDTRLIRTVRQKLPTLRMAW